MSVHIGITCDKCNVGPIEGYRYACLVCEDYDLCDECHHKKRINLDHLAFHPTMPILPPDDFAKAVKNLTPNQVKIFTCPYCGDRELSIDGLATHCLEYHSFKSCPVRCPICLAFRTKKSWIAEDTLLLHLLINHQREDGYVLDISGIDCAVCVEKIPTELGKKLACGHIFHKDCIDTWLQNKNTCPMCRKKVCCGGWNLAEEDDEPRVILHDIVF